MTPSPREMKSHMISRGRGAGVMRIDRDWWTTRSSRSRSDSARQTPHDWFGSNGQAKAKEKAKLYLRRRNPSATRFNVSSERIELDVLGENSGVVTWITTTTCIRKQQEGITK